MNRILVTSLGIAFLLTACGSSEPPKPKADPAVVAAAKEVWDTRCVSCHGPNGMGNGLNAKNLKTKPRTFRDHSWQKDTSDDRIRQVILEGGEAVGLSSDMAANPDLKDKPEVVNELLALVRGFG